MRSSTNPRGQLEVVGGQELAVRQHVAAVAVGHEPAAGEDDGALAQLGREGQVVRDDDERALDRLQDVEQLAARARVEIRGGLVEHEQRRLHREHGRDRDAASLAERELVRRAVADVAHAHGTRAAATRRSTSARSRPMLSGPKATSSRTVGMNS